MSFFINETNINLNNTKIVSIIQMCESLNIYIPRFCYHKKLSIAGNCRICLVEVEYSNFQKKMVIACGTTLTNQLKIYTSNSIVKKIRENILEFLLLNHPLDCPICDQAGECDLQDQTIIYGGDKSRFSEKKRIINDKNFGVFIKAIMTRCIHCTRCIRFFNEIVGETQLGTFGRGKNTEIGTYKNSFLNSEITGNIIDLCPVGALTSKPFSFIGRSWEFFNYETIDLLDSTCSSIRIDIKGNIIMRILPVINNKLNEEWITDKIRFSYDSFKLQRLIVPYIKSIKSKKFISTSYEKIFFYIKKNFLLVLKNNTHDSCYFLIGNFINILSQLLFKFWIRSCGFYNLNSFVQKDIDHKESYFMTDSLKNLELYNLFLLCGINTKIESSILNIKLKKLKNKFNEKKIYYFGTNILLNFEFIHLGFTCDHVLKIYFGQSFLCKLIHSLNKLSFIYNNIFSLNGLSFNLILNSIFNTLKINFSYNYISLFSSELNSYDIGAHSNLKIKINNNWSYYLLPKLIYFLGFDSIKKLNSNNLDMIYIYQGHHFDYGSSIANIILPSSIFLETEGYYLNCEGILKYAPKILNNYAKVLPDSIIIYSLLKYITVNSTTWTYNNFLNYFMKKYTFRLNKLAFFFTLLNYYNNLEILYVSDSYYINKIKLYYNIDIFNRNSITINKYLINTHKYNIINFF